MLVYFRKRIKREVIDKINKQIVKETLETQEQEKKTQKQKNQKQNNHKIKDN